MRIYIDGDYNVIEYDNGAVVRTLITEPVEPEPIEPEPPQPTASEIQDNQFILMDAIATLYEEFLLSQEV